MNGTLELVKGRLNYDTLLPALGFSPLKHGRTSCLLHGGDSQFSFSVNRKDGRWRCFVCNAHGDPLDLIQQVHGSDFRSALAWAADFTGVTLDRPDPQRQAAFASHKAASLDEAERIDTLVRLLLRDLQKGLAAMRKLIRDYPAMVATAERYAALHSDRSEADDPDLGLAWRVLSGASLRAMQAHVERLERAIDSAQNATPAQLVALWDKVQASTDWARYQPRINAELDSVHRTEDCLEALLMQSEEKKEVA